MINISKSSIVLRNSAESSSDKWAVSCYWGPSETAEPKKTIIKQCNILHIIKIRTVHNYLVKFHDGMHSQPDQTDSFQ